MDGAWEDEEQMWKLFARASKIGIAHFVVVVVVVFGGGNGDVVFS